MFSAQIPIHVSCDPDFRKNLKYANILLFDKDKKVLSLGKIEKDEFDTIVAPETEFIFEKELDEFTTVWKCGARPFYN